MERPLTSWKEIATHFNKSVRTVQRWEQQFGLPVRRPDAHDHGIVVAFPSELDTWMRTHLLVRPESADGNGSTALEPAAAPAARRPGVYSVSFDEFRRRRELSSALSHRAHELMQQVRANYDLLKTTVDRNADLYKQFDAEHQRLAIVKGGTKSGPASSSARAS